MNSREQFLQLPARMFYRCKLEMVVWWLVLGGGVSPYASQPFVQMRQDKV